MFSGDDYFHVGENLEKGAPGSQSPEAMYRAAISRYYYACYLKARSKLINQKDWSDKSRTSHSKVQSKVKDTKLIIGQYYETLRMLREHADYHVWKPFHLDPKSKIKCQCGAWKSNLSDTANYAHDLATWIIQYLDTLP